MSQPRTKSKFVRSFLDVFIMAAVNGASMYGYEIMALIHREFGVLLSPGTLYPLLHSLENKGLMISNTDGSKIVYHISLKGKEKYQETVLALNFIFEKLSIFIRNHKEDTLQEDTLQMV